MTRRAVRPPPGVKWSDRLRASAPTRRSTNPAATSRSTSRTAPECVSPTTRRSASIDCPSVSPCSAVRAGEVAPLATPPAVRSLAAPLSTARLADALPALRIRPLRMLLAGQAVSFVGDALFPVALAFAVLDELDGTPGQLGLVLAAQALPLALLVLVAGVWADRLPRQRLMLVSDFGRMVVQPVGPDACDEDEQGERERLRGEHETELAGRPVELVEDREGEGHREQRIAHERHRLAGQQQPQRADAQGGEEIGEAGGRHGAARLRMLRACANGGSTTPWSPCS